MDAARLPAREPGALTQPQRTLALTWLARAQDELLLRESAAASSLRQSLKDVVSSLRPSDDYIIGAALRQQGGDLVARGAQLATDRAAAERERVSALDALARGVAAAQAASENDLSAAAAASARVRASAEAESAGRSAALLAPSAAELRSLLEADDAADGDAGRSDRIAELQAEMEAIRTAQDEAIAARVVAEVRGLAEMSKACCVKGNST